MFLIIYIIKIKATKDTDKSLKKGPVIKVNGNNIINKEGIFSKKKFSLFFASTIFYKIKNLISLFNS